MSSSVPFRVQTALMTLVSPSRSFQGCPCISQRRIGSFGLLRAPPWCCASRHAPSRSSVVRAALRSCKTTKPNLLRVHSPSKLFIAPVLSSRTSSFQLRSKSRCGTADVTFAALAAPSLDATVRVTPSGLPSPSADPVSQTLSPHTMDPCAPGWMVAPCPPYASLPMLWWDVGRIRCPGHLPNASTPGHPLSSAPFGGGQPARLSFRPRRFSRPRRLPPRSPCGSIAPRYRLEVHRVSPLLALPSPLSPARRRFRSVVMSRVAGGIPTMRFMPFEELPSTAAVPRHRGPCPLVVTTVTPSTRDDLPIASASRALRVSPRCALSACRPSRVR